MIGEQIALRWVPPQQRIAFTQTIRGRVVDLDTEYPLIGANIIVETIDPIRGASTDEDGFFEIPGLPLGRHTLQVRYIGYEPAQITELLLTAGKEIVLDVALVTSPLTLDMVVVAEAPNLMVPLNESAVVSARSFSVEQTQRFAASMSDPARMAQSFSGISRSEDDMLNEVIVRGQSPKYTVWHLEGIEIPNPNHFSDQGHSSGGVSMLSTNILTYSDFFAGAFPAEYGNALAGVFDINMRKGNTERAEYTVGVGALGLEGTVEGPLGKKYGGSYLINYRYSTLGLLSNLDIVNSDITAYQDLAFKFHLPTKNLGVFNVFGLAGKSYYLDLADDGSCKCPDPINTDSDNDDDDEDEKKGVVGISNRLVLSETTFLKTTVAAFGKSQREGSYLVVPELSEESIYYDEEFSEEKGFRGNIKVSHRFNASNVLQIGLSGSIIWLDYNFRTRIHDPFNDWTPQIVTDDRVAIGRGYFQWAYRPSSKFSLHAGLHTAHFGLNKETTLEPRFGIKWQPTEDKIFSIGSGLHSQLEPYGIYFLGTTLPDSLAYSNRSLSFSKSWHNVLSFEKRFAHQMRVRTELYYNRGYDLPVSNLEGSSFSAINTYFLFDIYAASLGLVSEGTSTNYGLDLSIEKLFSGGFYFMLNGSLFDARYSSYDGTTYPSRYNTRFMTNLVTGVEMNTGRQKRDVMGINARVVFGGGNRNTPYNVNYLVDQLPLVDRKNAFSTQLSPYFRVDMGMTYTINKAYLTHNIYLDVQNVINRRNEGFLSFNFKLNRVDIAPQLGILPILGYRLTF